MEEETTTHTGHAVIPDVPVKVAFDLVLEGASLALVLYVVTFIMKGCGLASWLRASN